MATALQRTPAELKSAIETMFRIRAVESPPDEQGSRTIWHRGAKGADLITTVDAEGRVARQELFLFEDYFLFERSTGLKTGVALDLLGTSGAHANGDIAFDQDAQLRRTRLEHAAHALAPYDGQDKLIGHVRHVVTRAAEGKGVELGDPVTRGAEAVRLDDLKAASQELERRELEKRLAAQRRNLALFIGAVLLAAATVALWLGLR